MRLSVLICTHDRADLLARVLASLQSAARPRDWQVNILVVANACTDSTHTLLERERQAGLQDSSRLPLGWLAEPRPGKSYALNTAIPHVKGSDVVTFVDDDHRVDIAYLVEICRAADIYPEATMFCGRILADWDGSEPAWVHDEGPYKIRPLPIPHSDGGPEPRQLTRNDSTPGGGNLFLRGAVFDRGGHFPTDLGPQGHDLGGGEDSVFIRSALERGEWLMYVPGVVQYHYVDPDRLRFGYVLRKAFHRSRSLVPHQASRTDVPLYMWRKLSGYLWHAIFTLNRVRRRFYLVRTATMLGEISGVRRAGPRLAGRGGDRRRDAAYLTGMALSLATGFAAGASHDPILTQKALASAGLAAGLAILVVGLKSLADFTLTGPRLPRDIKAHYRRYAIFAFLRLAAYAFVISLPLAGVGVLVHTSAVSGGFAAASLPQATLAGIASTLLLGVLQFSRHLLWLPANITASYNYRLSRLYPYWQRLTRARLRVATSLLLALPAGFVLGVVAMLLGQGLLPPALALFAFLLFYGLLGLWLRDPEPGTVQAKPRFGPPNIVMIGSDTLRTDRMDGSYAREVAPFLRSLVDKGVLFNHCYVPCARTAPSLLSMLTGLWPHEIGVRDNYVTDEQTRLQVESLATILGDQGYYTAALSDWCGADMGKFTLGFDHIDVPADQWNIKYFLRQGPKDLRLFLSLFARNRFGKRFLPEIYYLGGVPLTDELGRDARRLINDLARPNQPFFLNLFFSTTHGPFGSEYPYYTRHADPGYTGESKFVMARLTDPFEIIRRQGEPREEFDLDQIINLYDGCVTRFDDEVKRLMAHLERCGLAENTLVVIYADHGMEFFEHNTWGQGNSVIGEVSNRIPLLICGPGVSHTGIIRDPVRSIDLMSTLEELCGITRERGTDSISLVPYLKDPTARLELDVFSETGMWLTDLPGTPPGHLHYPDLLELLTVRNKTTGTISLKPEYEQLIIRAKDRMIRRGRWKLVYQPLLDGRLLKLFDMEVDPGCSQDVSALNPDVVRTLWLSLSRWLRADPLMVYDDAQE
jgi:arylsulfatase A-like enzyme/glycosyltransferase involved in cell wall biosynthesis